MTEKESSYFSIKDLGKYLKDGSLKSQTAGRFDRIMRFYGYCATNANVTEFLTLILDNPEKYKKTSAILTNWKKPRSINDVFSSILTICEIPEVKASLGQRFDQVCAAHEHYIKELVKELASSQQTTTEEIKKIVKNDQRNTHHYVPPSEDRDDASEESDIDETENEEIKNTDLEDESLSKSSYSGIYHAKTISPQKLQLYIRHIRSIDNPMARLIADMMQYDLMN
jgi:arsenate reductase-like glutaredoxin family protein